MFDPPGGRKVSRLRRALPWLALLLPLTAAAHFLWLRTHAAGFPGGDEGSWMAVAAQVARGHGFTTLWLEHHWLKPYTLPRPDDFRYPGLTLLLAAAFRLFGTSYACALAVTSAIFLLFIAAVFGTLRRPLGFWPAFGAALLTACSPLQLQWNAGVYTEGLFGLGLAFWVGTGYATEAQRRHLSWWMRMGLGVGLLYLVRPNGLLLFAGILWQFARDRRRLGLGWNPLLVAGAACLFAASPWLIRTWVFFGNPLHIAGSAGLLRDHIGEPHTLSALQYFGRHAAGFPVTRTVSGAYRFFRDLHFFDQGLEILPLAGLGWGLAVPGLRRFRTIPPGILAGFGVSFAACAYAAWGSWAGVRYFSGYLPFVYGWGIFYGLRALDILSRGRSAAFWPRAAVMAALLLPVINPHRFYERHYRALPGAAPAVAAHLAALTRLVPPQGSYYAKSLGQLNFLADRRCVGLQELSDTSWFARSEAVFHPRIIALKRGEDSTGDVREALRRYRAAGFSWDTAAALEATFYLRLLPPSFKTTLTTLETSQAP